MPIEDPCIFCGSAGERDARAGLFCAREPEGFGPATVIEEAVTH